MFREIKLNKRTRFTISRKEEWREIAHLGPVVCSSGEATIRINIEKGLVESNQEKTHEKLTAIFKIPFINLSAEEREEITQIKTISHKSTYENTWTLKPSKCVKIEHYIYQLTQINNIHKYQKGFLKEVCEEVIFTESLNQFDIKVSSERLLDPPCKHSCERNWGDELNSQVYSPDNFDDDSRVKNYIKCSFLDVLEMLNSLSKNTQQNYYMNLCSEESSSSIRVPVQLFKLWNEIYVFNLLFEKIHVCTYNLIEGGSNHHFINDIEDVLEGNTLSTPDLKSNIILSHKIFECYGINPSEFTGHFDGQGANVFVNSEEITLSPNLKTIIDLTYIFEDGMSFNANLNSLHLDSRSCYSRGVSQFFEKILGNNKPLICGISKLDIEADSFFEPSYKDSVSHKTNSM